MRDPQYLRAQAVLCLEIARHMSDASTADKLKAEAARYQAEAMTLESGEENAAQDVRERSL